MNRRRLVLAGVGVVALGALGCAAGGGAGEAASLGFEPDPDFVRQARALMRSHPVIDVHAHPGRTFVRGATGLSAALTAFSAGGVFERRAIADMRAGSVCGASFSLVADFQVLDFAGPGLVAVRDFRVGEARESYVRQMSNLRAALAEQGAIVVREPSDFNRALAARRIGAYMTVEGADFLAGDIANVERAFADGLRSITLVHYRPNELGDIQTADAVNGGLTPFGADVIREMDRLGVVVDLAHASEATAFAALEVCTRPVMCSHTHLQGRGASHARFISSELAAQICGRGGVIGAWPAGIGMTTMSEFVDRIFDLAEALGPEHVCLGTDIDANFRPVFTSYRQAPLLVSELLRRGYGEENAAGFVGGNFLRVFGAVWDGRRAA